MIKFCALRDIARPDALTPREWEALGRLAVRVEVSDWIPEYTASTNRAYRDNKHAHMRGSVSMPSCKIRNMERNLEDAVFKAMRDEGLNSADFVVIVVPCYEPQQPAHSHDDDIPQRWHVELRLCRRQTAARQASANTHHAPTLSEQHGKARNE